MRLRFTASARRDLDELAAYIAAENPHAAEAIYRALVMAAVRLERFPALGRTGHREGTRELPVAKTPYVIVYAVEPDEVRILAILHAARDLPSALDERPPEGT